MLARNDQLLNVSAPRHAVNLDDWETSNRLLQEADSKLPDSEQERLAFVEILPSDVCCE